MIPEWLIPKTFSSENLSYLDTVIYLNSYDELQMSRIVIISSNHVKMLNGIQIKISEILSTSEEDWCRIKSETK